MIVEAADRNAETEVRGPMRRRYLNALANKSRPLGLGVGAIAAAAGVISVAGLASIPAKADDSVGGKEQVPR